MTTSFRKLASLTSLLALASVTAQEPISVLMPSSVRTWVDTTGKFSIEASFVEWNGDEVRLLRANGKRVAIDYDKLSDTDRQYLVLIQSSAIQLPVASMVTDNDATTTELTSAPDSTSAPTAGPTTASSKSSPPFELANATSIADEGTPLKLIDPMRENLSWPRVLPMRADPPSEFVSVPPSVVSIDKFDGWAECSRPLLVSTTPSPKIAISITRGLMFPTGGSHNQITFIDPTTNKLRTIWESNKRITLLDHHRPSGLTLVLNDHNSVGEGGLLELLKLDAETLASTSDQPSNALRSFVRHELPDNGKPRNKSKVRWARLVDDEHVVAVIDGSLGCWNLVSAECLYRVDKIDPRIEPVMSPGMRYLALPNSGALLLYSSGDGRPLGRIELDRNLTPNVAFSPRGDYLAIVSGKRLRVWDLARGSVVNEIENVRTLGTSSPVWLNDDLVMSSNGFVMSLSRHRAVWQYDVIGDTVTALGDRVALLRKYRQAELAILDLPHAAAANYIASIGYATPEESSPTKSKWRDGAWVE